MKKLGRFSLIEPRGMTQLRAGIFRHLKWPNSRVPFLEVAFGLKHLGLSQLFFKSLDENCRSTEIFSNQKMTRDRARCS